MMRVDRFIVEQVFLVLTARVPTGAKTKPAAKANVSHVRSHWNGNSCLQRGQCVLFQNIPLAIMSSDPKIGDCLRGNRQLVFE
ncbi:hypothetical protein W02_35420 [Nitrospira sp. KM1]|nr:hypothetical protein W02_35420 [Nitrospira sp. KM1]